MCGKKVLDTKNYKQTSVWLAQKDISMTCLIKEVGELCRNPPHYIQIKLVAYQFAVVFYVIIQHNGAVL